MATLTLSAYPATMTDRGSLEIEIMRKLISGKIEIARAKDVRSAMDAFVERNRALAKDRGVLFTAMILQGRKPRGFDALPKIDTERFVDAQAVTS